MTISTFGEEVPVDEDSNSGCSDIKTNDAVSDQDPSADKVIIGSSWWSSHDINIGGIETESSSWWSIGDEVNPEKLNGGESFWDTEHGGEEDGENLTNVRGDEISDEGFHVTVNGSSLFNSLDNSGKVIISKNHIRG